MTPGPHGINRLCEVVGVGCHDHHSVHLHVPKQVAVIGEGWGHPALRKDVPDEASHVVGVGVRQTYDLGVLHLLSEATAVQPRHPTATDDADSNTTHPIPPCVMS